MGSERGQGTVEWVGLVALVSLVLLALVAAGVRVPGAPLARAVADRILCAASLADGCGDEPALIAAYGDEVGELVRRHMPMLAFERGLAGGPGRLPPLPRQRVRRRGGRGPGPHDRRRPARHRLRPRGRLPRGGGGANRSRRCRLLRRARRQPLRAVLDLLRRLGDAARHAGRRGQGLPRRRLGERAVPRRPRRRASSSEPPPTTATTTSSPTTTGPPTPASSPTTAGARRPTSCSSPAAATPATRSASPTPTATPPAAASTWSRSSRSPPPAPEFAISPPWLKQVWLDPEAEGTS